jgi:hypothetical protein
MNVMRSYGFAITVLLLSASGAAAQIPPPSVTPPTPNLNPSAPLVLPPPHQVPVSPAPGRGGGPSIHNPYHSVVAFSDIARASLIIGRQSGRICA